MLPKRSLDGETTRSMSLFEPLFKNVSTGFGLIFIEKVVRMDLSNVSIIFPKSAFGEHKVESPNDFRRLNETFDESFFLATTWPLKSGSKRRIERFFVWGA